LRGTTFPVWRRSSDHRLQLLANQGCQSAAFRWRHGASKFQASRGIREPKHPAFGGTAVCFPSQRVGLRLLLSTSRNPRGRKHATRSRRYGVPHSLAMRIAVEGSLNYAKWRRVDKAVSCARTPRLYNVALAVDGSNLQLTWAAPVGGNADYELCEDCHFEGTAINEPIAWFSHSLNKLPRAGETRFHSFSGMVPRNPRSRSTGVARSTRPTSLWMSSNEKKPCVTRCYARLSVECGR
jgi:hypothetical protein